MDDSDQRPHVYHVYAPLLTRAHPGEDERVSLQTIFAAESAIRKESVNGVTRRGYFVG
jgi:hypothetical protein